MIPDQDVERAIEFLLGKARERGRCKGALVRAGHMRKHRKALMMKQFNELPVSAQEREAYASDEYVAALTEEAEAAAAYEHILALCEAAALKVEIWRSQSANSRAQDRALSGNVGKSYGA